MELTIHGYGPATQRAIESQRKEDSGRPHAYHKLGLTSHRYGSGFNCLA